MTYNKKNPAFPCMPIQDSLGRLVAPIPGFTKYEYVVLEIYKELLNKLYDDRDPEFTDRGVMLVACEMADTYFTTINENHADEEFIKQIKSNIIQ